MFGIDGWPNGAGGCGANWGMEEGGKFIMVGVPFDITKIPLMVSPSCSGGKNEFTVLNKPLPYFTKIANVRLIILSGMLSFFRTF